jgi:hypothetical protein
MSKVIKLKKDDNESNILDFGKAKAKKERMGMSEKEFRDKYMSNSVVSLFGESSIKVLNSKDD